MKRHWLRRHKWETIIRGGISGKVDTDKCDRCGRYRYRRLSDHEQAKRAS